MTVDPRQMEALNKWNELPGWKRRKILRQHMPEPRWETLRETMATMSVENMTPVQVDAVVWLMEQGR